MPITHSKQDWSISSEVRVGFMRLRVTEFTPTPGDWAPDKYTLVSLGREQHTYEFVPHMGLTRID